MTTATQATADRAGIRWWPSAIGIVFAFSVGLVVGEGFAAIVFVCALIYVFAAVIGRPGIAWVGYLVSVPLVALGPILDAEWLALAVLGALAVVLVVIGLVRGTWRAQQNARQLIGLVGFGVAALAGLLLDVRVGAVILALGLFAHGAWDVVHHRRGEVVSRSYAEFCAVLDLALGVLVVAVAFGTQGLL